MRNLKLVIEYDGSGYIGWQKQPHGLTVQEALENALEKITNENINLFASGRTDSGVHAFAQVANFKTRSELTTLQFQKALNSSLPKDIIVKDVKETETDFHAQYDAKSKIYLYRILNRPFPSALLRKRAWFVYPPLNTDTMNEACRVLIGEHDFSAFALSGSSVKTTVRTVLDVQFEKKTKHILEIEIEGEGFLRGMVRLIVGTLAEVGKGRITTEDFREILEGREKTKFVHSAPPWGLYLKKVKY